jgi:Fe-S-cluster containining protein
MHEAGRPVFALSFHASYRCRHSGNCCTAAWPIPVEADRLARMRAAISTGALRVAPTVGVDPFTPLDRSTPADPPALLGIHRGACVFFDVEHGRLCEVHRALGHDALPLACRQFPRVCVHDPRGTSVTLSHFCPTAASMLESSAPISMVTDAVAFPAHGEYAGLDVTTSLPPLVRPNVLMDWDAWWEVERRAVALLSRGEPVDVALARLHSAIEAVRPWRPTDGGLLRRVARAFDDASTAVVQPPIPDERWFAARRALAIQAIPSDLRTHAPAWAAAPHRLDERVFSRFLAAHAFANWTAHLGGGLRSWLRSVEIAYVVARSTASVASADLVLRHLVDPPALATICARSEQSSGARV